MNSQILAPAAALIVWTLIVLTWMALTRFPAISKAGLDLRGAVGSRGADLEGVLPPKVNWTSHNYTHLVEQPTLFYAAVLIIALTGTGDVRINIWLAWAYVGLRIVHSLVQILWNRVIVRFSLFLLATLALLGLAIHGLAASLH